MIVHVLVSDVGLNGYVVHGVYGESPSQRIVDQAEKYAAGFTGYQNTAVEQLEMDSLLPCGGTCARPKTGTWTDCYCYRNQCNDRVPA